MNVVDTPATDLASLAPSPEIVMSPTKALTARFEMNAPGGVWQQGAARASAGKTPSHGAKHRQGFRIGELCMMVPYEDASQLSEMSVIHRLANAPDWFCGMANLQGKLTPVFDLARYLGVEHDRSAKRMLLVLAHGTEAAGMIVDGLPARLRFSDDDERADPGVAPNGLVRHVRSAHYIAGQLWFDLDTNSLLDAIEHSLSAAQ